MTAAPLVAPMVGIIMGSQSDWPTLAHAAEMLAKLEIPHERRIVSAHRTPDRLAEYAQVGARPRVAGDHRRRWRGRPSARHVRRFTPLPVLGVPIESHALKGMDFAALHRADAGRHPVGTLAIGRAGAINAALLAAAILATTDAALADRLTRCAPPDGGGGRGAGRPCRMTKLPPNSTIGNRRRRATRRMSPWPRPGWAIAATY